MKLDKRSMVVLATSVCLAYLLPYHVHPFRAFYQEWIALFGLIIVIALQAEGMRHEIRFPWIAYIPLCLIAVLILQTLLGMLAVSWDAVLPLVYFAACGIAICVGATLSATESGAFRLCNALAAGHLFAGLISVGIGSLQFVGVEDAYGSLVMQFSHHADATIRPFANVGQPNQLALLFCLALASVWWFYQTGHIKPTLALVSTVILLWGLVFTQSRIGWIIVPAFAVLLMISRAKSGFRNVPAWAVFGSACWYATLVIALPHIAALFGADTVHVTERNTSDRTALFTQALQISLAHPVLGAGWYEFGAAQLEIAANFPGAPYSQHAHNIVLNFAAELGWPLTILTLGACAYWFGKAIVTSRLSKEVGFAVLFIVAVAVHSMVEFPLWYAYVLVPAALLIGLIHQEQYSSTSIQVSRFSVLIVSLISSALLLAIAVDYRRVVVGFRALGWQSLGLQADEGTTEKPEYTVFPHFYDYFRFARTKAREGMSPAEIHFMEHTAKRFGYAPVLMRMSMVYALNSRPDDAVRTMEAMKSLHATDYDEAYASWKTMADAAPEKFAAVYKRLPRPDPAVSRTKLQHLPVQSPRTEAKSQKIEASRG